MEAGDLREASCGLPRLQLSERTDHITAIAGTLAEQVPNLFLLHGRLSARQRGHPVPQRLWERRLRGYLAMGYELTSTQQPISGDGLVRPSPVQ